MIQETQKFLMMKKMKMMMLMQLKVVAIIIS